MPVERNILSLAEEAISSGDAEAKQAVAEQIMIMSENCKGQRVHPFLIGTLAGFDVADGKELGTTLYCSVISTTFFREDAGLKVTCDLPPTLAECKEFVRRQWQPEERPSIGSGKPALAVAKP